MKIFSHVNVLDLNVQREHFTKHGLHMNYKGKEESARAISAAIEGTFRKESHATPLQWKSDSMVDNEENRCLQESLQSPEAATRSSARLVKTPAHLRDFYTRATHGDWNHRPK
ncbi:hypothetical protein ANN_26298 [Periplaneta americana]|uniref:Uncharacterized protein n=1 Tax=Periplaneta americana TaxID=6978 RepID=A0ABQ8S5I1_PERAM|nr:hypothetical protein ANN_26298 [Periplaneta americana]